jgi:light-regulated signal transduction histidine kinase (bacteriophytochrome)
MDFPMIPVKDETGKRTKIILSDNGIGFDQQYAEGIFRTLTRLNSKDKYEGTGLGLAQCKKSLNGMVDQFLLKEKKQWC